MMNTKLRFTDAYIKLAHGAGGKASRRLIEGVLVSYLMNDTLTELNDAAYVEADGRRLAFTADSFVVNPFVFPGGSIGELAINGTVNDLVMGGAKTLALVTTLILEAGLATSELERGKWRSWLRRRWWWRRIPRLVQGDIIMREADPQSQPLYF
jgi:hydrogenase expression/formation protein HypE